ncbi:MAG: F0F1 ATP synthase subunit A [Planctomycetaceae bacterium]|nr:F0F1 ATP synthase subunit A [Planctomycetaceae bacterium]
MVQIWTNRVKGGIRCVHREGSFLASGWPANGLDKQSETRDNANVSQESTTHTSMAVDLVGELASHAKDGDYFHFPWGNMYLPSFLTDIGITKFVVLEVLIATIMVAVFVPMAGRLRGGQPAKGRFWNMMEVFLVYLRDNVIVPSIGSKKEAAPYIPYLWTLFFFILLCNIFGLVPWMGSPTAAITVTVVLSLLTLGIVIYTGIRHHGALGFWTGMVPHVEGKIGPINLATILNPILFVLEIFSFFVKHVALCIRLMANMFGGALIIAVLIAFIPMAAWSVYTWIPVLFASYFGAVAVYFLKLLVAFLQAYIFTFLTSIYIGMAIHQH